MIRHVLLMLLPLCLAGQDAPPRASFEGQVVNSVTGEPLRKAHVLLRRTGSQGPERMPSATVTDASGRFHLTDVQPGSYRIFAERNGFVRGEYGTRGSGMAGAAITAVAGETVKDITVKLLPQAVIAGRVLDEDGEPLSNVQVQALRFTYARGRRQLAPVTMNQTNDLGEFRLHSLAPGRYYVSATYRAWWSMLPAAPAPGEGSRAPEEGYVPTYYPRTNDPTAAAPVQVGPGGQMRGVDLQLLKTRTVRITGKVLNAPAGPGRRVMVEVRPREGFWMTNRSASSLGADGTFEIRAVAPGSYILTAAVFGPAGSLLARHPLEVGSADISGIELQLMPGIEVKGRVRLESGELTLTSLRPQLQPRLQNMYFGGGGGESVKEDGTFSIRNVAPDEYTVTLFGVPDGWYIKSAKFGEQEVLFTGVDMSAGAAGILDVLLSPKGAQVDGAVVDSDGKPQEGVTVALIPEAERRRVPHLYRSATTDQTGRFSLRGLTPGEYKLFAWEQVEPGAYLDPDFLQPFESGGERVSLTEGAREMKQLNAIPSGQ